MIRLTYRHNGEKDEVMKKIVEIGGGILFSKGFYVKGKELSDQLICSDELVDTHEIEFEGARGGIR